MKQRNYSVEFFRAMFAISFVAIHVWMVYTATVNQGQMSHIWALDTILPFMIFAGFFMMGSFKRQQKRVLEAGISPSQQAWTYLKTRALSLLPAFLVAQIGGFVVNTIFIWKTPPYMVPMSFINHLCELVGLQITGIGFGNPQPGPMGGLWVDTGNVLNAPLWFISGIIFVGFLVYFLLAKWEKVYLGFIGPLFALVFYGSQHLMDSNPFWGNMRLIGDFAYVEGFPHMFVGLTLGCLVWVAVDRLKDKEWSRGMRVFMTICSAIVGFLIIYKTWVPITIIPWGVLFYSNWGSVHVLSIIFSFFVLLNADGFTRLFNRKIFSTPGRMAFYVYMFHYPIILLVGSLMGVTNEPAGLRAVYGISLAVSIAIGYLFMKLDTKVIQPWFKKKPWYSEKQRELELELEKASA